MGDNKDLKGNSGKKDQILVLLYANWCGHCRDFYLKDNSGKPLELSEIKDKELITWQRVKKECGVKTMEFESEELKKGRVVDGVDLKELSEYVQSWPTIVMLEKNGDKYKILKQYKGFRDNMDNFHNFINECKETTKQEGGSVNYRTKYKKYKVMYRDLLKKYKQIGGK